MFDDYGPRYVGPKPKTDWKDAAAFVGALIVFGAFFYFLGVAFGAW